MALSIPSTSQQWNVVVQDGVTSLKYVEKPVPELDDSDVLVKSES